MNLVVRALKSGEISGFYISYLNASVGALLVGKIIIIMNSFSFINAFPNKPLLFNISWQFLLYGFLTLIFRLVELLIDFYLKHPDFSQTMDYLSYKLTSTVFWAIQMWVLMVFIVYIVASEFIRVLGREKIIKIFLG